MPSISRWFLRAALLYLALGFTVGALLLWNKGLGIHPAIPHLLPAHMEFLLVGWTIQLVMGVALWIFPRFGAATMAKRDSLGWAAFVLLNIGVWLVIAGTPVLGRIAEVAAAAVFATHVWTRVRASGLSPM
ncbi:MAG TPA: hypothetical protein VL549_16125 [Gemmatimonadales bacterium]|nr:hypothetical protein [Gemmatimonadales bacterium]